MFDFKIINSPDHYLLGRSIEPIEVIESWSLCHHLACVVKYIARCGRKENAYQDLKKAEWYLERKLILLHGRSSMYPVNIYRGNEIPLMDVSQDWQLPDNLGQVLGLLKTNALRSIRIANLSQALETLQAEIQKYEEENS